MSVSAASQQSGAGHQAASSSSVVGRERVKFYSRPVLPGQSPQSRVHWHQVFSPDPAKHWQVWCAGNQSLVPVIKYAPDVSRAGDDFTAEFLARRDSYDAVRRSVSKVASVSVQTVYREMETQTEPFTPDIAQPGHQGDNTELQFDPDYREGALGIVTSVLHEAFVII